VQHLENITRNIKRERERERERERGLINKKLKLQ